MPPSRSGLRSFASVAASGPRQNNHVAAQIAILAKVATGAQEARPDARHQGRQIIHEGTLREKNFAAMRDAIRRGFHDDLFAALDVS